MVHAEATAEALAQDGYRVLAVASADHTGVAERAGTWESGLSLLGLIALVDPPRPQGEARSPPVSASGRARRVR
ncbi:MULTISPECIES: hypothetical protein [unclassified Streptomyces]|uniref:hypothetical protein n=1 Tax=unclassified Streptomyces TaxID=2593676 RepID=UPI001F0B8302|nr:MULTISPECIES: hypothetical protein [unclassified Streptomyces]